MSSLHLRHCVVLSLKHTSNKPEQILALQDISRQTEDDFQPFIQNILFIQQNIPTWSHKNTYLCALSVRHRFYVPDCTFRCSFKEKCPLSDAKTQVKYVNPDTFFLRRFRYILLCFYYIVTETYYGGSKFKYPGSVPKS